MAHMKIEHIDRIFTPKRGTFIFKGAPHLQ